MSEKSTIEWTDASWNPTRGCTKIAPGCAHCYAKTFAERWRGVPGHAYELGFDPRIVPEKLTEPLKWKKPRRIFVDSMSDLFHEAFPFEYIAAVFGIMAACPQHTFQVLTKRPERALEFFRWLEACLAEMFGKKTPLFRLAVILNNLQINYPRTLQLSRTWPLPNVWMGTSIANQVDANKNIPLIVECPAAVHFVSYEPALGLVDLTPWLWSKMPITSLSPFAVEVRDEYRRSNSLQWVIAGGESGPGARPCNAEWIRSIVEQCKAAGVACFVKQLGAAPILDVRDDRVISGWRKRPLSDRKGGDPSEWPADLRIREFPAEVSV